MIDPGIGAFEVGFWYSAERLSTLWGCAMFANGVRALSILALGGFGSGCFKSAETVDSSQENQQLVYQMYAVAYNASTDAMGLSARFSVGGPNGSTPALTLSPPSSVTGDGQPLAPLDATRPMPGPFYTSTTRGFQHDHEFVFTGPGNKVYRNTTRIEPADHDPKQPTELSRSRSHTIPFVGPPLRKGEVIALVLDITADRPLGEAGERQGFPMGRSPQVGATSLTLTVDDFARLDDLVRLGVDTRKVKMMWSRTWVHPLQEAGDAGGMMQASYSSKPVQVTLVK